MRHKINEKQPIMKIKRKLCFKEMGANSHRGPILNFQKQIEILEHHDNILL